MSSADGGGSPTLRNRPVPVRQACWAAGSRSAAIQTRPAAWPDQVRHRAVEQDPAAVQHDHPLAQGGHVLGLVGRDDHRRRLPGPAEHVAQPAALRRVETGGRLVEDQQVRVVRASPGPARPGVAGLRTGR